MILVLTTYAWIEVQRNFDYSDLVKILKSYPRYMHNAVVLALSVAQWHLRNCSRGEGACAACDYQDMTKSGGGCNGCLAEDICLASLFDQFWEAKETTLIADKIYEVLRKKYDEELEKVEKNENHKSRH